MNLRFFTPDLSDKRVSFAAEYLNENGFIQTNDTARADFVLLGVNPENTDFQLPVFAGNVSKDNVFDYTKHEDYALKNAYLTAEAALCIAIKESEKSLINSSILITGYGRIGKALHCYLSAFSRNITVCCRSSSSAALAQSLTAKTICFEELKNESRFDFIFNTVPHPVFNKAEIDALDNKTLLIDLASFPGGVDRHLAEHKGIKLIEARGLPGKYSPENAGRIVGETVDKMIREVIF